MVQGTSSGVGKTTLVVALCRIFHNMGYSVAPFKSQNMSRFVYKGNGFVMSQAQAVQAIAAKTKPEPDMNPILLKPNSENSSIVYVDGKRRSVCTAKEYYQFAPKKGLVSATTALSRLGKSYDLVIMEGAGSPAEINLQKYDIANMRMASRAKSPVLLVTDIDRGGSFASLVGTLQLLQKKHRELVRGYIFNKFRGDARILDVGFTKLRKLTDIPVLGLVPYMDTNLPEEDSLDGSSSKTVWKNDHALEKNIEKLAKIVRKNVNIPAIEEMIK
ncbi:MAG: cobalamin biosynthesis protein CobQ [Cenarchaeum symbiont of Oopsacas minuta]|nr:cobalamin biosynthesis protein CobQ [Cenarchaeum symbiont of Oopsacas minuta]